MYPNIFGLFSYFFWTLGHAAYICAMSNPKPNDMDDTMQALQAQIERVKWNVQYHQNKLKEEQLQLQALEAAVHHQKTFGDASK